MREVLKKRVRPVKPLGEQVYEAIRTAILNSELKPGQRLIEEQLAECLGASRTPIRQAFHKLEGDNLIDRLPKGGFTVKPISLRDIEEIIDLRSLLESYAARLAAESLDMDALRLLKRRNENFLAAISEGDHARLASMNTEFHEALYKLCRNRRLYQMLMDLHVHFYRYRIILLKVEDMAHTSYQDHLEMIEAMEARDADRTEDVVRKHILKGKEVILEVVRAGNTEI